MAGLGLLTLGGLLLRLPSFDDSLFGDEVSTYFIVTGHGVGQVLDWVRSDLEVTPPLFFVLAWATHSFGEPAEALRLMSLAAGVAAIPLTYLLGIWTVGRRAALLGAALMTLSPFLIFYSTQARAYMLVLLLVLMATLALLRALETGRARWWIAYAAFACAAVYAHYVAVLVLAGLFGWSFLAHPRARRALLAASLAAAVGFLPWVSGLLEDRNGPNLIGFFEPFGAQTVARSLVRVAMGHPYARVGALPGAVAGAIAVAGVAAGLVGLALRTRMRGLRPEAGTALVLVLAFSAPLLAALYSAFGTSVFNPQNLIASWPGLALTAGALVARAGRLGPLAAALILAASALGAVKLLGADYQRPDYKAAVDYIEGMGSPRDPIVDEPFFANPISALDAALGFGRADAKPNPTLRLGAPRREAELRALARGRSTLDPVPRPSTAAVARRAARLARGRTLFLVALSSRRSPALGSQVVSFMRALPPTFRRVATASFAACCSPTIPDLSVRVYVLRDSRRRAAQ